MTKDEIIIELGELLIGAAKTAKQAEACYRVCFSFPEKQRWMQIKEQYERRVEALQQAIDIVKESGSV